MLTEANAHQEDDAEAQPVGAEVAATKPAQDVERCTTFARQVTTSFTCDDSVEVNTFTNSGNDRASERAAGDDGGELATRGCRLPGSESGGGTRRRSGRPRQSRVIHTRLVSGASKFILSALPYLPLAIAWLIE